MERFPKPIIIVSKCLGFASCRYNGVTIPDDFVEKLKPYVEFKPVCPEVEIGLGVPRDPVRIVYVNGKRELFQPAQDRFVTDKMNEFVSGFLGSIKEVDGFILKSRSPSCGIKDVKIYPNPESDVVKEKSYGFFGGAILEKFPKLAIEDEGRLTNFSIREHFLTKVFLLARFRDVKSQKSVKKLIDFHTKNKFLLMAYNQKEMKMMGKLLAVKRNFEELISEYEYHLLSAFGKAPRYTSNINVLMHGLGYFSDKLSREEKSFFLSLLEWYRNKKIPLSVPLNLLRSYIIRFGVEYLSQQTFFSPYPEGLIEITDSGKGKDY